MSKAAGLSMAMLLLGLGACATDGASEAPFTDPPVAYSIGVGAHPGIELRVDGAVRSDPTPIELAYPDVERAAAAPLIHLETIRDGTVADEIWIGFGACAASCAAAPEAGCDGVDVDCGGVQCQAATTKR